MVLERTKKCFYLIFHEEKWFNIKIKVTNKESKIVVTT